MRRSVSLGAAVLMAVLLTAGSGARDEILAEPAGGENQSEPHASPLSSSARGFSVRRAEYLAQAVKAATKNDEQEIEAGFRRLGLQRSRLFKTADLHCVVAEDSGSVVLAFRGSTTVQDWINDLKFFQLKEEKSGLPGRVHRGFFNALDGKWREIEAELEEAASAGKRIWIAGHSLGGGLSHLAAMRAAASGLPVAAVYTFASPRVGDERFKEAFERSFPDNAFRIVNGDDLVPHVPPAESAEKVFTGMVTPARKRFAASLTAAGVLRLSSYTHAGAQYVFDDSGAFLGRRPCSDADDIAYWQRMRNIYGAGGWPLMIAENSDVALKHLLKGYLRLLEAARGS
jgi:triacylglycerol lipase